ncbi:CinA family protein [Algihabitans albus]|uniref:CinA family protein n=1 Tax=Algihabitans albus TaxID=2164067 RepID=UPI000E5D5778|nr:CinA family protein [Algihabitans albus]
MFPLDVLETAEALLSRYRSAGKLLATAESCTGGLIAGALTEVAGSSDVVERGFVTYSNAAKTELLGVPETTLSRFGAVSGETAQAMAEGALAASHAQVALSVTGIAGPGGGSVEKPVGLVWFGLALRGEDAAQSDRQLFSGDRTAVRLASLRHGLHLLAHAF